MHASVVSQKFIAEFSDRNAGPSAPFVAKSAPSSAQDDSFLRGELTTHCARSIRICLLLLTFVAAAPLLRAQAPNPGQGTWDGKCYDNNGHVKPCGSASSGSGSSSSGATIDWAAARAASRARKEAKEEQKREKAAAEAQQRAAEEAAEAQRTADEQIRQQQEAVRLEAERTAKRLATFNAMKAGMEENLHPVDDTGAVDLSDLKDLDHATVPLLRDGSRQNWVAGITDTEARPIAQRIDAVVPPLPIPAVEAPASFSNLVLSHQEGILEVNDYFWAGWDMFGPMGTALATPEKAIMIVGKAFIAGEDGAAIFLAKKQEDYDAALRYLKNPEQARKFARIVQKLREGREGSPFDDPEMVRVAAAIADPKLNRSGAAIAWDAMISPPAVAAMMRKATIEVASEYLGDKVNEGLEEVTGHKEAFDALTRDRNLAVHLYKTTPSAERQKQLAAIIERANLKLADMYRVEQVATTPVGLSIGDATEKFAESFLGNEPKAEGEQ